MDHPVDFASLLAKAISARLGMLDPRHESAVRLFNGFLEGSPDLAIDLYAQTAVLFNHAAQPEPGLTNAQAAAEVLKDLLPWIKCVILKSRFSHSDAARRGAVILGEQADRKVREGGAWYALDLTMNSDASLYLDTRNLRTWIRENSGGKTVFNTFAYTGSLGVAARAGGASRVIQLDLNRKFHNLGKTSYTLNGFPINKGDFIAGDFFSQTSRLRREGALFDCIYLDPPFFSQTNQGVVDLNRQVDRLINKVRPLVTDGGSLVVINNALFVSGQAFMQVLDGLCADGYLAIETLIPVPIDFTGFPETRSGQAPADPAPFNHSTKICVLRVRRKTSS